MSALLALRLAPLAQDKLLRLAPLAQDKLLRLAPLAQDKLLRLPAVAQDRPEASRAQVRAEPQDSDLVALTLRGNTEAFATLVERYDRAVYHLAYRTLHDVEEARDATQEAFFKAFRSLRTFRQGSKFSTWIFAITYHACCDRLNRRKHYASEELPDRADAAPGPEARVIALDEASRLRAAIDSLPEKYRTVVTLFHLQGKQYEEIATVLGLPMGTVKTHLFRAKEQLRRLLSGTEVTES